MTQPTDDYSDANLPGSARWYLNRLCQRLMGRQARYNRLERYALGNHPLPNGDKRFVVALQDLQRKAKTNYCELVISAVTTRMEVKGFRVGDGDTSAPVTPAISGTTSGGKDDPSSSVSATTPTDPTATTTPTTADPTKDPTSAVPPVNAAPDPAATKTWTDDDAAKIWKFNDMDLQSEMIINIGATFGDTYVSVSMPDPEDIDNPDQLPTIVAEDPRQCIIEVDPTRPTRTLCALKMWIDEIDKVVYAVIDDGIDFYEYVAPATVDAMAGDSATLTKKLLSSPQEGGFSLVSVTPNELGQVSIVRGEWQPAFGTMSRGEAECIFDIQDRINHTILDRLVISKNQAYNQRWVSGADPKLAGKDGRANWRPGSDAVWAIGDSDGKFGQFEAADLTQILAAIRDDVGDLAAVSKTPATYLMNRMVNVSGDTLTQDQSALVQKIKARQKAIGWMFQKVVRLCFYATGDIEKAQAVDVQTLWVDPEIHALAEQADAFVKFTTAGLPLQLIMEKFNYSPDEIAMALAEQQRQEQMAQQQAQMAAQQAAMSQDSTQAHQADLTGQTMDHESKMADKNNAAKIQQTKISAAAKPKPSAK